MTLDDINLGLVVGVLDQRTTDKEWYPTYTGAASKATVDEHYVSKAPITNVPAFALAADALDGIAALTGVSRADLEARGFVIGTVLGKESEASAATGNAPPPVEGAVITGTATTAMTIVYPNADFTGLQATPGTAAHGTFIAVPPSAASVVTAWSVQPPSGGYGQHYEAPRHPHLAGGRARRLEPGVGVHHAAGGESLIQPTSPGDFFA